MLELDRLYLELAFLMMFSWICDHSLSVLHLRGGETDGFVVGEVKILDESHENPSSDSLKLGSVR